MSEKIQSHRDLIAWQRAMDLVVAIYQATAPFPKSEEFGLQGQVRRAAVSIPSNIAEGYARQTTKDYLRFLRQARGSAAELSTQCELSVRLGYLAAPCPEQQLIVDLDRILNRLIAAIKESRKRR
jgi:four helix bundle protein